MPTIIHYLLGKYDLPTTSHHKHYQNLLAMQCYEHIHHVLHKVHNVHILYISFLYLQVYNMKIYIGNSTHLRRLAGLLNTLIIFILSCYENVLIALISNNVVILMSRRNLFCLSEPSLTQLSKRSVCNCS